MCHATCIFTRMRRSDNLSNVNDMISRLAASTRHKDANAWRLDLGEIAI